MRFGGNKIFVVLALVLVGADAFGMNPQRLGGISFSEYRSGAVGGSSLHFDPAAAGNLTAVNIYALAEINRQLRNNLITRSSWENAKCFSNAAAVRQSLPSLPAVSGRPASLRPGPKM